MIEYLFVLLLVQGFSGTALPLTSEEPVTQVIAFSFFAPSYVWNWRSKSWNMGNALTIDSTGAVFEWERGLPRELREARLGNIKVELGSHSHLAQTLTRGERVDLIVPPFPITEGYLSDRKTPERGVGAFAKVHYGTVTNTPLLGGTAWDTRTLEPKTVLVRWSEPNKPELAPDLRPGWSYFNVDFAPPGNLYGQVAPSLPGFSEQIRSRADIFTWHGKNLRIAPYPASQGEFIGATGDYALFWNKIRTRANTVMRMRDGKLTDLTPLARRGETFVTAIGFVGHREVIYCVNTKSGSIIRKSRLPE